MEARFSLRLIVALQFFALSIVALPTFINAGEDSGISSSPHPQPAVNAVSRESILAISSKIDSLVNAQLDAKGEKLNPLSSDEVFLRRAYLDIIGRIPTINETKKFLASSSKSKRTDLIDDLLDSYGYVSRQFNFWADTLRVKSRLPGQLQGVSYIDFIKDSLEENKPYDQFVRELVTAQGANLERGNGAVGYYLRDRNMPEDNMSNTVRIFLGTRLECAQCHDHPFDKWTQRQYFEMVAFTGGIRYRNPDANSNVGRLRQLVRKGEISQKNQGIVNRLSQSVGHGISGSGTGLATLPEGFLGEDGYEGEVITGKTMFDRKKLVDSKVPTKAKNSKVRKPKGNAQQGYIQGAKALNSREAYANWMTDPTNPRFAKVIANRLWKQTMGLGLIEPIDIIEDNTVASNPELMDYLTETVVALNFDMKQFLRAIYNSNTYQAAAFNADVADPQKFNFNGPLVRRMTAEQIWDSLMVLTAPRLDERYDSSKESRYASLGGDSYSVYEKINSMSLAELKQAVEGLSSPSRKKSKNSYKDDPEYKKMMAQRSRLNKQLSMARKKKNTQLQRNLMIDLAKLTANYRQSRQTGSYLRASEMTSPAPAGHFLRQFGQSDREQIENANTDPAVPQVLSMMNGYVEEKIARDPASVLMQTVLKAKDEKECTDMIFLSMLNRKPTSKEAREWKKDFSNAVKQKDQAKVKEVYADLIWTLANSNEFIFVK
ncbi:MAG: DUF1549 domain-containing protein [Mariniblastus sp.]|nr:DUF1549 domain-containing protein [Mariniblastus sp.]